MPNSDQSLLIQSNTSSTANYLLRFIILAFVVSASVWVPVEAQDAAGKKTYVLGVGDEVRVTVHGEPDLSVASRLNDSGVISYPFLGEIRPVGMTIAQLEQRIINGLKPDYLLDPQVNVAVTRYRDFYINGQIRNPGGFSYSPGLTVQKAVALAGGFTVRASTSKMFVIRERDPKQEREQVNLDTAIYPGDTLIIEEGLF